MTGETSRLVRQTIDRYAVTVRRAQLPACRGLSHKLPDGYLVLIDDRLTQGRAERALLHELLHIKLGHFDHRADLPEWLKELEVNQALKELGI